MCRLQLKNVYTHVHTILRSTGISTDSVPVLRFQKISVPVPVPVPKFQSLFTRLFSVLGEKKIHPYSVLQISNQPVPEPVPVPKKKLFPYPYPNPYTVPLFSKGKCRQSDQIFKMENLKWLAGDHSGGTFYVSKCGPVKIYIRGYLYINFMKKNCSETVTCTAYDIHIILVSRTFQKLQLFTFVHCKC